MNIIWGCLKEGGFKFCKLWKFDVYDIFLLLLLVYLYILYGIIWNLIFKLIKWNGDCFVYNVFIVVWNIKFIIGYYYFFFFKKNDKKL